MSLLNHHAIFYIGATSVEDFPEPLRVAGDTTRHIVSESLSIADVRDLKYSAHRRFSETQHFVIVTGRILTPAQNALLKLLEEPPENVRFHFGIPEAGFLLPTVRSRVLLVDVSQKQECDVSHFLNASYAERLELINEKQKSKDTIYLQTLARGLGEVITSDLNTLKSLNLIGTYFNRAGASRKMLLEYAALTLPVGKTNKIL